MARPFQFRLRTMFWLVALVAVLCFCIPWLASDPLEVVLQIWAVSGVAVLIWLARRRAR